MTILKVSDKKGSPKDTKLAGAYLSRQVSDYLTLYSLAHGITKTIVIRNEIQHWYDSQMEKDVDLVKMIAKKARTKQKKWDSKVLFKKNLKEELERKQISEVHISTILTALE